MTEGTFPRRMALATDLSHRCDRALDRALLVARAWQAVLTVIHALAPPETMTLFGSLRDLPSWRRPPDPVRKARDRIYRDLVREDPHVDIAVHVETGSPAEVVLEAARESHAELIVTGVARDELLARMFLGDKVDRLIRKSPVPGVGSPRGGPGIPWTTDRLRGRPRRTACSDVSWRHGRPSDPQVSCPGPHCSRPRLRTLSHHARRD